MLMYLTWGTTSRTLSQRTDTDQINSGKLNHTFMRGQKETSPENVVNLAAGNIAKMLTSYRVDASNAINQSILELFHAIGSLIDHKATSGSIKGLNKLMVELEAFLKPAFGNYFEYDNIMLMWRFSKACSTKVLTEVSPNISWDYIPELLELQAESEWIFYVRLVHQESLRPAQLSARIKSNDKTPTTLALPYPDYPFLDLYLKNNIERIRVDQLLTGPSANKFQDLFFPKKGDDFTNNLDKRKHHDEIFQKIYDQVIANQIFYNALLNIRFNYMFWNIGKEILRSAVLVDLSIGQITMMLSENLKTCPGITFDSDQLMSCITFNRQYKFDQELDELCNIVQWGHIKILLTLENQRSQISHARYVLSNNFSPEDLLSLIEDQSIDVFATTNNELISFGTGLPSPEDFFSGAYRKLADLYISRYDLNRNIYRNADLMKLLTTE